MIKPRAARSGILLRGGTDFPLVLAERAATVSVGAQHAAPQLARASTTPGSGFSRTLFRMCLSALATLPRAAVKPRRSAVFISLVVALATLAIHPTARAARAQSPTPPPAAARSVGTVKSIADKTVTLATDAGEEIKIVMQDATKLVRVAPGQTDIKQATPIALSDLQPGDRILVRGTAGDAPKSILAASVIAMAKTDVAAKQAKDREEWQKHGLGGIVGAVDPALNVITVGITQMGQKKSVAIKVSPNTVLRRYAPDSVKFDDAKPAPLDKIHPGDQLRARGTKNADGTELAADEVVSGTFKNISGTISALDAAAGTIVVQDLTTKKPVTVKISSDSQLRKLTQPAALRIAARMKGETPAAPGAASPSASGSSAAASGGGAPNSQSNPSSGAAQAAGSGGRAGMPGGGPNGGPGGGQSGAAGAGSGAASGGDLQQMLSRMPASNLSDLQKGDAVMIVTTEGSSDGIVTAITLLAGVEPILEASPKGGQSSLLSAWSLGSAPGGDSQ
jgi:hypothetical protein